MGIDEMGNYVVSYHTEDGPFLIAVHHPKAGMRLWSRDLYQSYGAALTTVSFLERVYPQDSLHFYVVTIAATKAARYKILSDARKRKLHGVVQVVEDEAEESGNYPANQGKATTTKGE